MATLDPSNIVNGNIIEPNDILQLYSALGSTNPGSITGLVMTGSLDGNASTATTASYATTALNASVTQVNSQKYDDGSTILSGNFKFVAGKVTMSTGTAVSSAFLNLVGKTLGIDAFITANYISGNGPTDSVIVDSIDFATGVITFINNTTGSPVGATIVFTGIYI